MFTATRLLSRLMKWERRYSLWNARTAFEGLHGGSHASYAIRFAVGFEGIMMVPSGMSDMAQMQDNINLIP